MWPYVCESIRRLIGVCLRLLVARGCASLGTWVIVSPDMGVCMSPGM